MQVCKICDKFFKPKRITQKFCNPQCRIQYWKKNTIKKKNTIIKKKKTIIKSCKICNKDFISKRITQKFCNPQCNNIDKNNKRRKTRYTSSQFFQNRPPWFSCCFIF